MVTIRNKYLPLTFINFIFITAIFLIEHIHYDNYVYSHFGFVPETIGVVVGSIIGMCYFAKSKKESKVVALIVSVTLAYGFMMTSKALGISTANFLIWSSGRDKLEKKLIQKKFGSDLDYISFIIRVVPEKSTVIIPPYTPARRHTSDLWMMTAWLYSRKVIQSSGQKDLLQAEYVIFTSEAENDHPLDRWPDFEIPDAEVYVYDWDNDTGIIVSDSGYSPDKIPVSNPWGYIKLKK